MALFTRIINKVLRYIRHRPVLNKASSNTQALISTTQVKKLLILCYGNIYRSPFVANYLTRKLSHREISIRSAGTYPKSDRSSPNEHIVMSRDFGVDLTDHRSKVADRTLLDWADWIVIMDIRNWDELEAYGNAVRNKIVWLGTLGENSDIEIQDPYGRSEKEIQFILKQLQTCSDNLVAYI